MSENNFKSTVSLFSKIKEDFSSFDNASLIDEGRFHKDVKYILNLLGLNWYRKAETMLDVCSYKVALPEDFHQVDAIYKCTCNVRETLADGVVLKKLTFDYYPTQCDQDPHHYTCGSTTPESCIFNRHEEILIQRDNIVTSYSLPVLLKPGNVNTQRNCSDGCPNIFADNVNTFTIQNGYLYTNFREGGIYLMYNAFPLDEEGYPMIADNENLERCIEYFIKMNLMESFWINSEADVERKLRYFQEQYKYYLGQAIYETKLPTFENMVKQVRLKRKSLDIYQF